MMANFTPESYALISLLGTVGFLFDRVSGVAKTDDKVCVLNQYVARVEYEMKKVEIWKDQVIRRVKDEIRKYQKMSGEPVLFEFIPSKFKCGDENSNEAEHRKNGKRRIEEDATDVNSKKQKNETKGKFPASFTGCTIFPRASVGNPARMSTLHTPEIRTSWSGKNYPGLRPEPSICRSDSPAELNLAARKQRRRWTPELHSNFVNTLEHLGASTPRQIRELMKVDGLTNDEVKSHLQKYRLQVQRDSKNSALDIGTSKGFESTKMNSCHSFSDRYLELEDDEEEVNSRRHGIIDTHARSILA